MYEDPTEDYPWEQPDESWRSGDEEGSVWKAVEPTCGPEYRAMRDQAERDAALAELLGGAAIVDEPER